MYDGIWALRLAQRSLFVLLISGNVIQFCNVTAVMNVTTGSAARRFVTFMTFMTLETGV